MRPTERIETSSNTVLSSLSEMESASSLLARSRKLHKWRKQFPGSADAKKIRIAIYGSHSVELFSNVLELFLLEKGVQADFYIGPFDSLAGDIFDSNPELLGFSPTVLLHLTHCQDVKHYPAIFADRSACENWTKITARAYQDLWAALNLRLNCQIIQTNFVLPIERKFGNLEANYGYTPKSCLLALNACLAEMRPQFVTLLDFEYLASLIGKERWFSEKDHILTRQGFSFDIFGRAANYCAATIAAVSGITRKCLVLDLDNTLWGGIVGDDGVDGINVDPNQPEGEAFLRFQSYVKNLKDRGVILAVCSKNDKETALAAFDHNNSMPLTSADFSCFVANWEDKASNLLVIAEQLNIGLDSLVFFDDNPAEREQVRQRHPAVAVVEVPEDPAYFCRVLEAGSYFDWVEVTPEDLSRSGTYASEAQRIDLESRAESYDSYLESLTMKAKIRFATMSDLSRMTQLINKTNQFNVRSRRYTAAEITAMYRDPTRYNLICIDFKDVFSNFGQISCMIIDKGASSWFIDTWVMSCRVFKRSLEDLVFKYLLLHASQHGVSTLEAEFIPTKKNSFVSDLFPRLGFVPIVEKSRDGAIHFQIEVESAEPMPAFIQLDPFLPLETQNGSISEA